MCFSSTVSFSAAAVLGATGIFSLSQTTRKSQIPLAAFPLFFAVQQFVEGLIWVYLARTHADNIPYELGYSFLLFAEVLWPLMVPLAVFLVEPQKWRRYLICPLVLSGIICSAYLFYVINTGVITPSIHGEHILYRIRQVDIFEYMKFTYLVIVSFPFLLSSHRWINLFGIMSLAAFIITNHVARETFISTWCFAAAILSIILCIHFWLEKKKTQKA